MAATPEYTLIFTKEPNEDYLLHAYNNNIVEFYDDGPLEPVYAHVELDLFSAPTPYRISPDPEGNFRFNLREPLITKINQNNFNDDATLEYTPGDPDTAIVNDTIYHYLGIGIKFTVFLTGGGKVEAIKNYRILKSVENLKNYADRIMDHTLRNLYLLTPSNYVEDREVHLTFWDGYPFDIPYYLGVNQTRRVVHDGSVISPTDIDFTAGTGRFIITDGLNDLTEPLNLKTGINNLNISLTTGESTEDFLVHLKRMVSPCLYQPTLSTPYLEGIYIKWANMYGFFNYWLFNQKDRAELDTKSNKPLFNDYDDLSDNQSPFLGTGRDAKEVLTLHSKNISKEEILVLKGLFMSPKIYLYTGVPGTQFAATNWVEVELTNQRVITKDYKKDIFNISCKIELPQLNTFKL